MRTERQSDAPKVYSKVQSVIVAGNLVAFDSRSSITRSEDCD